MGQWDVLYLPCLMSPLATPPRVGQTSVPSGCSEPDKSSRQAGARAQDHCHGPAGKHRQSTVSLYHDLALSKKDAIHTGPAPAPSQARPRRSRGYADAGLEAGQIRAQLTRALSHQEAVWSGTRAGLSDGSQQLTLFGRWLCRSRWYEATMTVLCARLHPRLTERAACRRSAIWSEAGRRVPRSAPI